MEKFSLNHFSEGFTYMVQNHAVAIGFLIVAGVIVFYLVFQIFLQFLNIHKKIFIVSVQFPVVEKEDLGSNMQKMESVFDALSGIVKSQLDTIFIEILRIDKYISIQLGSNKKEILTEAKSIFSLIPRIQFTKTEDRLKKLGDIKARTVYTSKDFLPIGHNDLFYDSVINYLSSIPEGKQAGIQILLRGVQKKFWIETKMFFFGTKSKE